MISKDFKTAALKKLPAKAKAKVRARKRALRRLPAKQFGWRHLIAVILLTCAAIVFLLTGLKLWADNVAVKHQAVLTSANAVAQDSITELVTSSEDTAEADNAQLLEAIERTAAALEKISVSEVQTVPLGDLLSRDYAVAASADFEAGMQQFGSVLSDMLEYGRYQRNVQQALAGTTALKELRDTDSARKAAAAWAGAAKAMDGIAVPDSSGLTAPHQDIARRVHAVADQLQAIVKLFETEDTAAIEKSETVLTRRLDDLRRGHELLTPQQDSLERRLTAALRAVRL